jgi:hypothetical protein
LRRILLVVSVAALMAAMVVASAMPAFADKGGSNVVTTPSGNTTTVCNSCIEVLEDNSNVHEFHNEGFVVTSVNPSGCLIHVTAMPSGRSSVVVQNCE